MNGHALLLALGIWVLVILLGNLINPKRKKVNIKKDCNDLISKFK